MNGTKLRDWDPAEHLRSDDDIAAYLGAAFDDGNVQLIVAALDDVARAKGFRITEVPAGRETEPPPEKS